MATVKRTARALCPTCVNRRWIVYRVDTSGGWHCAAMACPRCNKGQQKPPPYRAAQPAETPETRQIDFLRQ